MEAAFNDGVFQKEASTDEALRTARRYGQRVQSTYSASQSPAVDTFTTTAMEKPEPKTTIEQRVE